MKSKVEKWCEKLLHVSSIAQTHPQAAYAGFTHGVVNKWSYLTRTMENVGPLLKLLEDIIRTEFIPALSGVPAPSDELRDLFALSCRLGGLAILNPTRMGGQDGSINIQLCTSAIHCETSSHGWIKHTDVPQGHLAIQRIEGITCVDKKNCLTVNIFESHTHGMHSSFSSRFLSSTELE